MNLQYFFADFPCSGLLGPHIPRNARELVCQEERRYGEFYSRSIHPDLFGQKGHLQVAVTPIISR
jgi:hypothetical protein